MLRVNMIQEIQDLKALGLSLNEVMERLSARGTKAPSLPTVRKYYRMESIPDDFGASLKKDMVFDREPFKSSIIEILERNPKCQISSVYDVLVERFVDSGQHDVLPGSEQTLRNFVHHLKQSGELQTTEDKRRTYDHVFDTPPGEQMLIDFGEQKCKHGLRVHFICLLLRYSRLLVVYAQDHKFNALEACRAIYRSFTKIDGRVRELVIDQDAVFIASETYGEVIETQTFKEFITEQDLRLWVCNKSDPESKGPIENSVGFVKKNFFSAREFSSIEEVTSALPGWLERKGRRIHQATFCVPIDVFTEIEKPALSSLLPSVHELAPINLIKVNVGSMPYIQYKSSKYSIPYDLCYSEVYYKAIGQKLHIYDKTRIHICTHDLNPAKGTFNRLDEHVKEPSQDWMITAERMREKYNCFDFQHFINGFKKENGRHLAKQLKAVEDFLDAENPPIKLVSEAMGICCRDFRYRFSQFKSVYGLCAAKLATPVSVELSGVEKRKLQSYQEAFEKRCVG